MNSKNWAALKDKMTAIFLSKTRDQWCEIMEGTDICFAPILSMAEAPDHPHNKERGTFIQIDGKTQPAPAPRYSVTQNDIPKKPVSV